MLRRLLNGMWKRAWMLAEVRYRVAQLRRSVDVLEAELDAALERR